MIRKIIYPFILVCLCGCGSDDDTSIECDPSTSNMSGLFIDENTDDRTPFCGIMRFANSNRDIRTTQNFVTLTTGQRYNFFSHSPSPGWVRNYVEGTFSIETNDFTEYYGQAFRVVISGNTDSPFVQDNIVITPGFAERVPNFDSIEEIIIEKNANSYVISGSMKGKNRYSTTTSTGVLETVATISFTFTMAEE